MIDYRFLEFNPAAQRISNITRADIVGHTALERYPHINERGLLDRYADVMATGKPAFIEDFYYDGDLLDKAFDISCFRVDSNHFVCMFRDVTAKKRNEKEREAIIEILRLANNKNNTHQLIQAVTAYLQRWSSCEAVGIRLKDGDDYPYFETRGFPTEFVEAERTLCVRDINGQIQRDTMGAPILECMCGNILCGRFDPSKPFFSKKGSFWSNCTTELLASTTDADRQARTRNRCNGEGYESVALIALRYGNKTVGLIQLNDRRRDRFSLEFISTVERMADSLAIALIQRSEAQALNESNTLNRLMIEHSPVPLFLHRNGLFIHMNPAALRLFHASRPEDLLGTPVIERVHPEYRSLVRKRIDSAGKTGLQAQPVDEKFICLDGTVIDVNAIGTPITYKGENAILVFARDISEQKKTDARLNEQLDELRRWHNLTLGREKRIIDLKNEVNQLLATAGLPQKYNSVEKETA